MCKKMLMQTVCAFFFSPMEGWSGGAASAHAHQRTHSRLITKNKENKVNEFFLEYYYI